MHDHVRRYHVNTSCRLAYFLSVDLMAHKRKFRSVVLSSAAEKAKRDRDKFRTTTQVVLEEQKVRWVRLKVALKRKSDLKAAEDLLDT